MRSINKPKALLVALLTCAAFSANAAWWDSWKSAGDDGNVNTKGNAAAAANKGKTPQSVNKTYVGLSNQTNSTLTSAVLKDKSGNVLYTSTAGRTCAIGAVCWLRVSPGLMTKGNTFFFYSNNKLVSAYTIANQPANAPLYNIGASMNSLGIYVFNKIHAVNPQVTYSRIDNDIQTTTLSATPYQELADYYLDLMGNAKDNSAQETKVIKSLADQFAKNKVIPANPTTARLTNKKPVMAKAPQLATTKLAVQSAAPDPQDKASSPLCSDTMQASMGWLALIPMVGDAVKTVADTVKAASCPDSNQAVKDDMANQFSRVNEKLDGITTLLNNLQGQLRLFEQTINTETLYTQKNNVDVLDDKFTIWLREYQRALLTSVGADGKPRNSLNELISSFKTFDAAMKKNPELKGYLDTLYDDNTVYQAIIDLAQPTHFTTSRVIRLCGNPNNIAGNVLEVRSVCNATMVIMYGKNIILEKQMEYAYNDISKVYPIDSRNDKKHLLVIPASDFTAWVKNAETMDPKIALISPVKNDEPVYSLTENLRNKGFQVTGWYPEADKRYVETIYTLDGNDIKSKYAYQHPTRDGEKISYAANAEIDSNIANVMGVPVPERFFTGNGKDRNNYGANEAFPWTEYSVLNNQGMRICLIMPNVVRNAFSFNPDKAYSGSMISPNNGIVENERRLFVSDAPDCQYPGWINPYLIYYTTGDFNKIGNGDFFTLVRYTAKDGYSYVWDMRTHISDNSVGSLSGSSQCMTNDCLAVNTGAKLNVLKFNNGPKIEWNDLSYKNFQVPPYELKQN